MPYSSNSHTSERPKSGVSDGYLEPPATSPAFDLMPTTDRFGANAGLWQRYGRDVLGISGLLLALALGWLLASVEPVGQSNLSATGGSSFAAWVAGRLLYWFGAVAWLLPIGVLAGVARWWLGSPPLDGYRAMYATAADAEAEPRGIRGRLIDAGLATYAAYRRNEATILLFGVGTLLATLGLAGMMGDAATIHPVAPTLGGVSGLVIFDLLSGTVGPIAARLCLAIVAVGGVALCLAPMSAWRTEDELAETDAVDESGRRLASQSDIQPYTPASRGYVDPLGVFGTPGNIHPDSFSSASGSYRLPPRDLLPAGPTRSRRAEEQAEEGVGDLLMALANLSVPAELIGIECGPTVTRYTLQIDDSVPVLHRRSLGRDLPSALADANVRVLDPAPNRGTNSDAGTSSRYQPSPIAVEVPNHDREDVELRDLLDDADPIVREMALPVALGRDAAGEPQVIDLAAAKHLLIAGGDEGSAHPAVDLLLLGLILRSAPDSVGFALLGSGPDAFTRFDGLPHLWTAPTNDVTASVDLLNRVAAEIGRREEAGRGEAPALIVAIDEWADLVLGGGRDSQTTLQRILSEGPAQGIHVLMVTHRPSLDVLPTVIRDLIPTRLALRLPSAVDSRTVLGQPGAERLLDQGDALLRRAGAKPTSAVERVQLPRYDERLLEGVLGFVREQPGSDRLGQTVEPGHDTVIGLPKPSSQSGVAAAIAASASAAEAIPLTPTEMWGEDLPMPALSESNEIAMYGKTWTPDEPYADMAMAFGATILPEDVARIEAGDTFAAASQVDPFASDDDGDNAGGGWIDGGSSVAMRDVIRAAADEADAEGGTSADRPGGGRYGRAIRREKAAGGWDDLADDAACQADKAEGPDAFQTAQLLSDASLDRRLDQYTGSISEAIDADWVDPMVTVNALEVGSATEEIESAEVEVPGASGATGASGSWGGDWQPTDSAAGAEWGSDSFVDMNALRRGLVESTDGPVLPTGMVHGPIAARDGDTEAEEGAESAVYDAIRTVPKGIPVATLEAAIQVACDNGGCSVAILQRHLGVTPATAQNLMTHLEAHGIVASGYGRGKRSLRIDPSEWRRAS